MRTNVRQFIKHGFGAIHSKQVHFIGQTDFYCRARWVLGVETGCFFFNWCPPKSSKCYIVNPIKKVLSVRIYLPKKLVIFRRAPVKKTPCISFWDQPHGYIIGKMRLNFLRLSFEELSDGLSKGPFLLGVVKHHPPTHDKEYIQEFSVSAVVLSRPKIIPSTTALVLIQ